ncbi:MAG: hypothetical protein ROO73_01080 [Roseivirga sp.]
MIEEFLQGNQSKTALSKKYTGQHEEHGQMLNWMRKLGYAPAKEHKAKKTPPSSLELRLALQQYGDKPLESLSAGELREQLKKAQLKIEGYELMIQTAEEAFKIPIRKKSDTK